jgi:hypothetical protein
VYISRLGIVALVRAPKPIGCRLDLDFPRRVFLRVSGRGACRGCLLVLRLSEGELFGELFSSFAGIVRCFCLLCLGSRICVVSGGRGESFFPLSCVEVGFYCTTVGGGSQVFPAVRCLVTGSDGSVFLFFSSLAGGRWSFNVYVASRRWFRAADLAASTKFGVSCEAWKRSWSWDELFRQTGVPAVSFRGVCVIPTLSRGSSIKIWRCTVCLS